MRSRLAISLLFSAGLLVTACRKETPPKAEAMPAPQRLAKYVPFRLETDLSTLTKSERRMIPLLIEAARVMDDLFWLQAYGNKNTLLSGLTDPDVRRFAEINYGPWDRLDDEVPFVPGVGPKPLGANLYPADMTKQQFETAVAATPDGGKQLKSLYTLVRRTADRSLEARPYHAEYAPQLQVAAVKLREAAKLAASPGLRKYLELRADALLTDDYMASDLAWMDMKDNTVDVVIGPIETYEDRLFGYKAAYEAYVLVKDKEWSRRLAKYSSMLPALQKGLPVPDAYKQEKPGLDSDLNAYDAIYYAGHCNAGSKTIAINLPNDEEVQLKKGTRRLQLKNAMRAKFDKILLPIAGVLIAADQRKRVGFDPFFAETMFHEVAHGLGIKKTIGGKGTVREAMKEHASSLEEGKADILGLYMISELHKKGELGKAELLDYYVTFLAGIFRSIRFGGTSAHGAANLVRFNYFEKAGAFTRDAAAGTYRVNEEKMRAAVDSLSEKIIRLQGDGDYDGVGRFFAEMGAFGDTLKSDLARLAGAGIPVDVVFEQ
jgi:Peptidase family M49